MGGIALRAFTSAAVLIAAVGSASADPLAAARSAKAMVDYERALVEVDRALAAGDLSPGATREALLLRAEFLAVLDRSGEAIDTFVEVLAVDPEARIDPGLAPRVRAAFEEAARRKPARLKVSCAVDRAGTLRVSLERGSSARARFVLVERAAAGSARQERDQVTPPSRIVLTAASSVACFAVDERGNRMAAGPDWDHRLEWSPPAAGGESIVGVTDSGAGEPAWPVWRNPWVWGGAALAAGAGGVTFAWLASRDQDRLDRLIDEAGSHQFAEAEEVLDRGRSRVRWSRGFFVAAGVLAAGAVTFAFLPRRRTATSPARAAISLEPQGLWLMGTF